MAIVGTLPVQLANGTLADATQVMSDFNYVVTQVNSNSAGLLQANNFIGVQTVAGDAVITASAAQTLTNKTITATGPLSAIGTGAVDEIIAASVSGAATIGIGINNSISTNAYGAVAGSAYLVTLNGSLNPPLVIGVSGVERMRIDTSGNVGIGQATIAGYKLDVAGTIRSIGGEISASGYGIRVLNSTLTGGGYVTAPAGANAGLNISGDSGPITTMSNVVSSSNTFTLGITGARWGNVFSVLGNFSGAVTTGALTASTLTLAAGAVAAGTYTPTLFNTTNVAGSTPATCQYMQVGNVVTVSGTFQLQPTAASVSTVLGMSLPVASNFATFIGLAGTASGVGATVNMGARVIGDSANHRASITYVADSSIGNANWSFTFTYVVV